MTTPISRGFGRRSLVSAKICDVVDATPVNDNASKPMRTGRLLTAGASRIMDS